MLHPSYSELMEVLNNDTDLDNRITSRYTIVIAAARRARQLVDGSEPITKYHETDKAVSIAVNEMVEGKIKIIPNNTETQVYQGFEYNGYNDYFETGDMDLDQ